MKTAIFLCAWMLILVVAPVPVVIGDDAANAKEAISAHKDRYEAAMGAAQRAYSTEVRHASRDYTAALDKLIEQATKAGKLDAALAIREERERLVKEAPLLVGEAGIEQFEGKWRIQHTNGKVYNFYVDASGRMDWGTSIRQIVKKNGDWTMDLPEQNKTEHYVMDGPDRMLAEHYYPKESYYEGKMPATMAIVTRQK